VILLSTHSLHARSVALEPACF